MLTVDFADWENRHGDPLATWSGPEVTHWVPRTEQVWLYGIRYEVIRVEHVRKDAVICFVRQMS